MGAAPPRKGGGKSILFSREGLGGRGGLEKKETGSNITTPGTGKRMSACFVIGEGQGGGDRRLLSFSCCNLFFLAENIGRKERGSV